MKNAHCSKVQKLMLFVCVAGMATAAFADLFKSLFGSLVLTTGGCGFFTQYLFGLVVLSALARVGFYKMVETSELGTESKKNEA